MSFTRLGWYERQLDLVVLVMDSDPALTSEPSYLLTCVQKGLAVPASFSEPTVPLQPVWLSSSTIPTPPSQSAAGWGILAPAASPCHSFPVTTWGGGQEGGADEREKLFPKL